MSVANFGTEERLVRELLETVATENCWGNQETQNGVKVGPMIDYLVEATSFERQVIQVWYNEAHEKVSKRVKLDISVSVHKLQADKTKLELVSKWGVFCLVQVVNSENKITACEKAQETIGKIRSRCNSFSDLSEQPSLQSLARQVKIPRKRVDSENRTYSEDELLSPSPHRKLSTENAASSPNWQQHGSVGYMLRPLATADFADSESSLAEVEGSPQANRKRSLTQAEQAAAILTKQSDSLDSNVSFKSAENSDVDSTDGDTAVDDNLSDDPLSMMDITSDLLTQRTGTAKGDGIFQRPNVEFNGVVCNPSTAIIVSLWFRLLEECAEAEEHRHAKHRASVDEKASPYKADTIGPSMKRKGTFLIRWLPAMKNHGRLSLNTDNKACLGFTTVSLQNQINTTTSGWVILPKPKKENGGNKSPNKASTKQSSHPFWNKKPLTDCQHAKEFQVQLQVNAAFHKITYNERNTAIFKEWMKTYFEAARLFFRHALLRQEAFKGDLSTEADRILTIFARQKNISDCTIKMLNLAAVMSMRQGLSNQFMEASMYYGYINNAVKMHQQRLLSVLPQNGLHDRPKSGTMERQSLGQSMIHISASAPVVGVETPQSLDPVAKMALSTLVPYASTFVSESIRMLDDEGPVTFPVTDDSVDYLQKRIEVIWEIMNSRYLPDDVREILLTNTRRQFANRFYTDARNWFRKRLDGTSKANEKTGGYSLHVALIRRQSVTTVQRDSDVKKPSVDTLDQLRDKITTLIEAIKEATKHCTPKLAILNQLRTYRLSYFVYTAAGIDSVATEQVKKLLPRFIAYQRKHQMFQSNLTITSGLSFKLYRAIVDFARLNCESISGMDNEPAGTTSTAWTSLLQDDSAKQQLNGETLAQYEEIFQPCVVYWLHAFRDMSITRIRDAVTTDLTMASLYDKPVSVSAYDSVTCISEMINECRHIEFKDPRQSMLINVRSVDIACELIVIYATAIIKQAYNIKTEQQQNSSPHRGEDASNNLFPKQMDSPRSHRRKASTTSDIEFKEAKEIGERLMRALSNIHHVSSEIWRKLESNNVTIEIDEQSIAPSTYASRDTGISSDPGDHDPSQVPMREERLTKDLVENCRQTLESIINRCIDAHSRVTSAKAEHLVIAYLQEASVSKADLLISNTTDFLVLIGDNLEGELAVRCVRQTWTGICQLLLRNMVEHGKRPPYYAKVLKFVGDLEQIFSSTETDRIVIFPRALQEDEAYKKLVIELTTRSQRCQDLIKTYLRNIANCDETKLSPSKKRRQSVKHFQNDVENPPLLEGQLYIQVGKVISDGNVVLAIHGLNFECPGITNYYTQVSLKPDFEFKHVQLETGKQNRHDTREFHTYEFTGLSEEQMKDVSNVLVIEIWRKRVACDSFLGELVIPLADIPESVSRTNIFDHTETKALNFYQPRTLNHLLDIMHTREQFSQDINHFLRWRLSILLRVDLTCVVRANQLKLQMEELSAGGGAATSTCTQQRASATRQSSSISRQSTETTTSETSTSSIASFADKVKQWLPDTEAVALTLKAHRALVGLNIASHRNSVIPTCFVRYIAKE